MLDFYWKKFSISMDVKFFKIKINKKTNSEQGKNKPEGSDEQKLIRKDFICFLSHFTAALTQRVLSDDQFLYGAPNELHYWERLVFVKM